MKTILFLCCFFCLAPVDAQKNDCAQMTLQTERDQMQIDELSRQVAYYKNLLQTTKAVRTATFEDVRYDIREVRGLRRDGTILIEFTYENIDNEPLQALQVEKAVAVEPLGKRFQTTQVALSPDGRFRVNDLLPGVSYKAATVMKRTSADFPTMRALVLYVYPRDRISNPQPVVFENVPVVWE